MGEFKIKPFEKTPITEELKKRRVKFLSLKFTLTNFPSCVLVFENSIGLHSPYAVPFSRPLFDSFSPVLLPDGDGDENLEDFDCCYIKQNINDDKIGDGIDERERDILLNYSL